MKTEYSNRALNILYLFVINNGLHNNPIILPTNICHDVYFLLKFIGNELLFLDINSDTLELDTRDALEKIKSRNEVILLWNHTYGNEEVPYEFFNEAKKTNPSLIIIDDRCLCNPAFFRLVDEDNIIDLILFSTGNKKQIDLGLGAIGLLNEAYIISDSYHDFDEITYREIKSSFKEGNKDDLDKGLENAWTERGVFNIEKSDYWNQIKSEQTKWNQHKKSLRGIYSSEIGQDFFIDKHFNDWRFNILVKNKTELIGLLQKETLFVSNHYPSIGSFFEKTSYPTADWLYKHVLNLFIDKYYTTEMAYKTAKIIREYGFPL